MMDARTIMEDIHTIMIFSMTLRAVLVTFGLDGTLVQKLED
jgi:hypothetical protein